MSRKSNITLITVILFGLIQIVGCSDEDDPVTPDPSRVGTIVVNPTPDILNAPWDLTGPNGYSISSSGDQTLTKLSIGEYTITWGDLTDYVTPSGSTQSLVAGGVLAFNGTYVDVVETGTIIIDQTPDVLSGSGWTLTGPQNDRNSGDATLSNMPIGRYILRWDAVSGHIKPSDKMLTLEADGTLHFTGTYFEDPGPVEGFVMIPPSSISMPATFTMGSPVADDENSHQVTLTGRYNMAVTEVTNGQYIESLQWAYDQGHVTATSTTVLDNMNDSTAELLDLDSPDCQISFDNGVFSTSYPDRPVITVSWYGSAAYCDWLSLQAGWPRAYNHYTWSCNNGDPYSASGYRLPTEAEWEFACRAGTTTPFNTGECLDASTEANYAGTSPYTDCPLGPYLERTADVASYAANQWGLFDMHGNVWEWCNDWYDYYSGDETDPVGSLSPYSRVMRGGGWGQYATYCRSANRSYNHAYNIFSSGGFRPVRSTQ